MVEVFITNIQNQLEAKPILENLQSQFPEVQFNFDFEAVESTYPCSHSILRVEGTTIKSEEMMRLVKKSGVECDILEDKLCK